MLPRAYARFVSPFSLSLRPSLIRVTPAIKIESQGVAVAAVFLAGIGFAMAGLSASLIVCTGTYGKEAEGSGLPQVSCDSSYNTRARARTHTRTIVSQCSTAFVASSLTTT